MTSMTITMTIERTARAMQVAGAPIVVEELGIRLPFARKPIDLSEVVGSNNVPVYITETHELTPSEFDAFTNNLLLSRDWLRGKGGPMHDGHLCVEVRAAGRPLLYVDPWGTDYGRYVARLG